MSQDLHWRELAEEMSRTSEEAFFAGWMDGLEYRLWEAVHGGPRKYGQIVLTRERLDRLQELSSRLGGWVWFNDDKELEEFLPIEQWLPLYEQWQRHRGGENGDVAERKPKAT